ncbi:helix-turn-helix transcriptional regulator [Alcaligenes faecalis]|uniref:helix-turn-helix transcriptional regulator n=1 Tax=Alcaligenes faecalis TaxID=511 RepID=UPI0021505D1A|nr:AlpA family phage regulatory protein [Alcaligenes faecalis]MCR4143971.1 AlpA family phage regulatory protein [Alcaligenes faecalis]
MNTNTQAQLPAEGAVRIEQVLAHIGIKRTALYDRIAKGHFPRPRKIGNRSVWLANEVREWLNEQPAAIEIGQGRIHRIGR